MCSLNCGRNLWNNARYSTGLFFLNSDVETGTASTDVIGDFFKFHLDLNLIDWLPVSASEGVFRTKMDLTFSKSWLLLGS
jgi:hypothetical protein